MDRVIILLLLLAFVRSAEAQTEDNPSSLFAIPGADARADQIAASLNPSLRASVVKIDRTVVKRDEGFTLPIGNKVYEIVYDSVETVGNRHFWRGRSSSVTCSMENCPCGSCKTAAVAVVVIWIASN